MSQPVIPIVTAMLVTMIVPLVILYSGKALSAKYPTYKKVIGAGLITISLLEIVGFFQFSITINGVSYLIPQQVKMIILVQGFMTLCGGLLTFYSKPPEAIETIQKIT